MLKRFTAVNRFYFLDNIMVNSYNKDEIFKRAYTGLINSPANPPKQMIQATFAFDYYGKTALFLGTANQGTFYFFLTDDGLILEYIDGRLNVLNAKRSNENYDIQSDKEVLNNINSMFEELSYYLFNNCFHLFADCLSLINESELSVDDRKLLKLFKRSKSFELGKYSNYPNFNKVINNIIIPQFFKSPLLNINSSQLELNMSGLEEYYLLVRKSADEDENDGEVGTKYSNYINKLNTSISTTFQKYDPSISFKLNDNIDEVDSFNIISYDIKPLPAFLFPYIDNNTHKKYSFFTLENFETKNGGSLTNTPCYIDYICESVLLDEELSSRKISPIIALLYHDDKNPNHIRYNDSFLIFGASRVKKIQSYLNERIKSEFLADVNNATIHLKKRKLLSEEDFIADMRKIYQEIKQKENYKHKCAIQIINNANESFESFFANDIEVI